MTNMNRRDALFHMCGGLGGVALTWLLQQQTSGAAIGSRVQSLQTRQPAFAPRAENVIFIYMGGGLSQIDLFDPKPAIKKYDGQDIPISIFQRSLSAQRKLMASPFRFSPQGKSGIEMSELLPHLGQVADEITLIRSATTNRIDHDNAQFMFNSGRGVPGFPTMGSWVSYGLGTVNQNLPAYVALAYGLPGCKQRAYSSAWLPPLYQGTQVKIDGVPIYDLKLPEGMTQRVQDIVGSGISVDSGKGLGRVPHAVEPCRGSAVVLRNEHGVPLSAFYPPGKGTEVDRLKGHVDTDRV